jgi:hypothetical protein
MIAPSEKNGVDVSDKDEKVIYYKCRKRGASKRRR